MRKRDFILYLLVLASLSFGIYGYFKKPETIEGEKEYFYDTKIKKVAVSYPVPYDSLRIDTVPANVDTLEILKKYFSKYYYKQTLEDSNLVATITDTIGENRIQGRAFEYQWKKPIAINTILPSPKLFIGGFINGGVNKLGYGGEALFATNKKAYSLSYNIPEKSISIGVLFKIK